MAPPRSRRSFIPSLLTAFLILLALIQTACAQSVVLGLDVGTEYIKAALVKPGVPLDIVLTKDSRRKEAAAIGFKPVRGATSDELPERLYGSDALAVATRFPSDIYPNIKPLLGAIQDSLPAATVYKQRYPGLEQEVVGNAVALKNTFDSTPFAVEELLAMELSSMKANAQGMAGSGLAVRNAVITIPAFFTVDERRAIELAAKLAGLNVMSIISDGLAVGLNYATSRNFPNIDKGEKAEHHLVFDMGAGSTSATVLRFQARTVKDVGKYNKTIQEVNVLGTGWDRALGGDMLNQLIVGDMIQKFVESAGAKSAGVTVDSVKSHGRTMSKLWREAERLRQLLSANSQGSGNFESLFEDIDFRYKLTRADFEGMAEIFRTKVTLSAEQALANAKLTVEDLDSVVLHGGMVRTPLVQKELENYIKDPAKLRSNVNADEAAVFGAAYRAADLSPSFKVKDIKTNDMAIYGASLKWTAKGKPRTQNVFVPTSQAGVVKQMPFNISDDFSVSIMQHVPKADGTQDDRNIGEFKVANLTASIAELISKHGCIKEEISTTLSIRLDPVLGLPEISGGSSSCETSDKKTGMMDGVKGLFGLGDKKEQEPLSDESGETTETIAESSTTEDATSGTKTSSSAASSKSAKPSKPKKNIESINLAVEVTRTDHKVQTEEEFTSQLNRLKAFDKSDKARRLREEAFNTLEAFLYRAGDIVAAEDFIAVSTPAQRTAIESLAASTSEWLHGDQGSSAVTEVLTEKYTELTALIDPIQERKDEQKRRPNAIESLRKTLKQAETLVSKMRSKIDEAAETAASFASSATDSAEATASEALEDLEDEAASATVSARAAAPTSIFSEDDYEKLSGALSSAADWLKEQVAEQDALGAADEPVLRYRDVNTVTKQLNEVVAHMLGKEKIAKQQSSYSSRSSKKSKTSSSTKSASAKLSTTILTPESDASESAESQAEKHGEL